MWWIKAQKIENKATFFNVQEHPDILTGFPEK